MNETKEKPNDVVQGEVTERLTNPRYEQLKNAVCDLLAELRIDEKCLEVMANGYSPDYPGAVDLRGDEVWKNPGCKIQLSRVVARKLVDVRITERY